MGKLFIICGPSGVGKKTLINSVINNPELNLTLSVSCTSRSKRSLEIEGKDYFFITKEEFEKKLQKNEFIEHAKFFDNYYGTEKNFIENCINGNKNLVLEIETIGYQQMIKKFPDLISIFILPPTINSLKERLMKRNTEDIEKINIRLEKSNIEIEESKNFKYQIINDEIEKSSLQLQKIIFKELHN